MIAPRLIVPLTLAVLAIGATGALGQTPFPAPLPNSAAGTANDPAFPPVRGSVGTPNDPAFPPVNGTPAQRTAAPQNSPFPPVNGASATTGAPAAFPSGGSAPVGGFGGAPQQQAGPPGGAECMKNFVPLREEAEKRGKLIQAAGARHAPPDEACKLIAQYSQAEAKMVKFVDTNSQKCGIPDNVGTQMHANHKATEAMHQKVCDVAKQAKMRGPAGPSLSEALGSAGGLPEATTPKKGGSTFDTLNGNVLTR
ncbi:hypothetical protein [Nitrobacter sp. JJSN]|uniref:hypothetical protein n=1 Tax=Nitrobacter sp. JJSN TaxID=3453033 RepID=UPI003F76E1B5